MVRFGHFGFNDEIFNYWEQLRVADHIVNNAATRCIIAGEVSNSFIPPQSAIYNQETKSFTKLN